jgi:hypothetical protein
MKISDSTYRARLGRGRDVVAGSHVLWGLRLTGPTGPAGKS